MDDYRLGIPRRVEKLSESGLEFLSLDTGSGCISVVGLFGDLEVWGPPRGNTYAILFMGREFEFYSAAKSTPAEQRQRKGVKGIWR